MNQSRRIGMAALAAAILLPMIAVAESDSDGDRKAGKAIFEDNCILCHGASGQGNGSGASGLRTKPANFKDLEHMSKISEDTRVKAVTNGGRSVKASKVMPAFKDVLTDEEIRDVLAYIRHFSN